MTTIELDAMQRELERAATTYEQAKRQLYRADGSKRYSDMEHKEREAQLLAPLQEAADRARVAAQAALDESDRDDLIADFDPLLALAGKQSDLVMVKQSIIAPTVDATDLRQLARRLAAVAAHGDEVDKRLYALHTRQRLEQLRRSAGNTGRTPDGFGEAAGALRELESTLVDKEVAKKLAMATHRRQRALELTRYVSQRVGAATGATEQARRDFAEHMRASI